ncbi:ABC transporter substrate-binding protein [Ferrovibrio sp.]|uniref:ABC transporter substrate-binding protein n=1 Tax=Ferrovibrio sp. TaxID=1917215 RepID=UPI003D28A85A
MATFRLKAALLAGALALAAISTAAYAPQVHAQGKTLRWASQGDYLTFDPHSQNEGLTRTGSFQVYEGLLGYSADLKFVPALATSWKALDATTWEFKLRQGVKFHGGESFTADDVVFSVKRAQHANSDFKTYIASVKDVKKVDDFTVHVITDGANPILPNQIANIFILSKSWAEKHNVLNPQSYKDKEETYAVRNANGTGPFSLKLREQDVRTVTAKNPTWWGLKDAPHNIDEIVYTPVTTAATRVAALLSGQLDFVLDVPVQDVERVRRTSGIQVKKTNEIRSIFLGLDVGSPELKYADVKGKNPLADKRVRQALYHAIDMEAIRTKVMRGDAVVAGMITSPGVHGYDAAIDKRLPYDVAKAKKLLADAGYPNGFGITLDCSNDRYVNDEAICQAVVGMLAQAGIKVDLAARSKTLHFPKLQKKDSSFFLLGWGVPTFDSHYVFSYLVQTPDGKNGSWNFTNYSNPKLDGMINGMLSELDATKRDKLIRDAWDIVNDEVIYLPLHHQVLNWAMADKLDMPIIADNVPRFHFAKLK